MFNRSLHRTCCEFYAVVAVDKLKIPLTFSSMTLALFSQRVARATITKMSPPLQFKLNNGSSIPAVGLGLCDLLLIRRIQLIKPRYRNVAGEAR
jgi:hypothetical protein